MPNFMGTHWFDGIFIITPLSQAIAFLIETSSWLVRAQSSPSDLGLYVGRSNIYLYSARLFTLIFTASLAFAVETGYPISGIFTAIHLTFLVAAVLHAILLFEGVRMRMMSLISGALLLPKRGQVGSPVRVHDFKSRLFFMTLFTSVIFSLSLTAPILGAILVPAFRLSISYIGQVINFFGTIVVLFFVDQILFRAIDHREVNDVIMSYVTGRLVGFFLIGILFLCIEQSL
jgi:hypothetical protein